MYPIYDGGSDLPPGDDTLTLTLSGNTEAVDFYEEPNTFDNFTMTATDSSGVSVSTVINGDAGSSGVGFYEDRSRSLANVTIVVTKIRPVTCQRIHRRDSRLASLESLLADP